jgi:D-cysteine desulfhydrase
MSIDAENALGHDGSMPVIFPQRFELARLDTPLQDLPGLSERLGKRVRVWRDDLTGWALGGNKIRKLEYLCAEAAGQGADHLVTCGGPQSNHTRATAFAARTLGWDISIVVREPPGGLDHDATPQGNLLLNQLLGAKFIFVPYEEYQDAGAVYEPFLEQQAERLWAQGARPFVIPEGGSCPTGCWGYLAAMSEKQDVLGAGPFDLFCAVGSGGTLAGLELGRQSYAPQSRLHGVNVCDSAEYFQDRVGRLLDEFIVAYRNNGVTFSECPLRLHDGFVGEGYALAEDKDLRFYAELARETGLLLDPVYTGKAFRGMLHLLETRPDDFSDDIVFLHSGGQFASFAFAHQYQLALA